MPEQLRTVTPEREPWQGWYDPDRMLICPTAIYVERTSPQASFVRDIIIARPGTTPAGWRLVDTKQVPALHARGTFVGDRLEETAIHGPYIIRDYVLPWREFGAYCIVCQVEREDM